MKIGPAQSTFPMEPTASPPVGPRSFATILDAHKNQRSASINTEAITAVSPRATHPVPPGRAVFKQLFLQAMDAENNMDRRINEILSGKIYSPGELIALQAEVFRYSQTVEVLARITEKVVGGLKQVLSTQV